MANQESNPICKNNKCLPGLQGFPVRVSGLNELTEKSSIVTPNDIHLQFSPSEMPIVYDIDTGYLSLNGMSSFHMGGTNYTIKNIRLCKPAHDGISGFPSNQATAELHIWGSPNMNSGTPTADLALLSIPLQESYAATPVGNTLFDVLNKNPIKLTNLIPQGNGADIMRYSTCVETNDSSKRTITIAVAYWMNGASYTRSMNELKNASSIIVKRINPEKLPAFGVPAELLEYKLLSSRDAVTAVTESKDVVNYNTKCVYKSDKNVLKAYMSNVLNAQSPEFLNSFRVIRNFKQIKKVSNDTSRFKCIAINPSRDVKDGKLLLDPATGKRFDQELEDKDAQINETLSAPGIQTISNAKMWLNICITIGYIVGISLLAGLAMVIFTWTANRKSVGLPPAPPHPQNIALVGPSGPSPIRAASK